MCSMFFFFFFKQKTAYEMRISDWSSDVCSSDLVEPVAREGVADLLPQFVGREVARVDQPIRPAPERRQQLALPPDAVARRAIGRKRMAAARFVIARSEEHTSELQSLMRISYAVFCLKKQKTNIERWQNEQ